ncbi:PREDICTED: uncharacterized protein LOC104806757 isoform X2 [Tarenaya hassleriana]|uniref:uncharacterized protein LOC104806757 isoform X2 n=1 Tax=Tarenaya hassleriana TaxID=28532 RepID=UPI00053C47E1|nr:PREDICTED: uncharacterized protein LOC104806757 isoform X2 [Tarenaya hassleriana]
MHLLTCAGGRINGEREKNPQPLFFLIVSIGSKNFPSKRRKVPSIALIGVFPRKSSMDLRVLHLKDAATRNPILLSSRNSIPEKPFSGKLGKFSALEIRVLRRKLSASGSRSLFVRATAKKGNGDASASGDASQGNKFSNGNKSDESASQKSHGLNMDWREFRANLFMKEQAEKAESEGHKPAPASQESKPFGLKWAHPIPVPETGCVLVATEKLDGIRTFERTVVLLLRSGTRHPQEGPFGVVINRPLHKNIKHMKPTNNELASTFSDCPLYFGGPLQASMFLLKTGDKAKLPGFEEVMPGLSFGARNSLDDAAALVKKGMLMPQDFKFFVGYAGWQLDQLREEIESNYWYAAACSSDLICGASSENLWEEILQLMGGHYSELSRKPKQDM